VADEISAICLPYLTQSVKNIILHVESVKNIDEEAGNNLVKLQQTFYENNGSFVVCCLQKNVENNLENWELLELMNTTPTESEAWDIIQMEEIERELLDSDDVDFAEE
ncbi:MAG: STAS domain-containing protein, partial [Chitinophagaceae bacterium]|nr:STAS domain-containing protein [Chitinophagaceae bacterium]